MDLTLTMSFYTVFILYEFYTTRMSFYTYFYRCKDRISSLPLYILSVLITNLLADESRLFHYFWSSGKVHDLVYWTFRWGINPKGRG